MLCCSKDRDDLAMMALRLMMVSETIMDMMSMGVHGQRCECKRLKHHYGGAAVHAAYFVVPA